ncbi:MAG: protein kinase [Gammaproteobacteria bacterium]|nr:protein kinase [Gammaproteobacteria bacterium]
MEPHRTGRNEPRASLIEPGRTLGPYLVLSTLSCGPRSVVYMAQDLSLDRPVALKTAPRGAISVIAEGRVLARFGHPHIVTLHGLWSEPSVLILEYLVGETLKARRERVGTLAEDRVGQWIQEVLSALEAVHGQGLAHGAIRADNVFLTTDQRIKLLDFRQTSLGESPPTPADDVRAAGRLMQELLGAEAGALTDVVRGALLGRYPTARALRLAVAAAHRPVDTDPATGDAGPRELAPPPDLPADGHTAPAAAGAGAFAADLSAAELSDLFEEPSINPMLPAFHERPGWGRPLAGRKRLGLAVVLVVALVLLGAKLGWLHRQAALQPVAHVAHTVVRMAHGVMPKGTTPRSTTSLPGGPATTAAHPNSAHPKTVLRPGAYAALAHAWGG